MSVGAGIENEALETPNARVFHQHPPPPLSCLPFACQGGRRPLGLPGVRQMSYIDEISWQLRSYPSYVKGGINQVKHEEI